MTSSAVHLSTEEFYGAFLTPTRSNNPPPPSPSSKIPFAALKNANKMFDKNISEHLVSAINSDNLAPGFKSSQYSAHADSSIDKRAQKNSTAIFRAANAPSEELPPWSDLSVPIEVFTHHRGIDPFDPTASHSTSKSRQRLFDRISTVAEVLFAAQQRVFLFMLLVIGRKFRFLRWDRSGVIVTPAIDYFDNPYALCDLLWRISLLDDISLGLDPSATRVLPGDVDFSHMDFLALDNPSDLPNEEHPVEECELDGPIHFEYVRAMFRKSLVGDWPRYRVQVGRGERTRHYLVGKPTFCTPEMFGRGTLGYVAYDCKSGRFVWLKDAWRASYMIAETEGDVLRKLNAAKVQYVPTLVCDGDVRDQTTITADWWERKHLDFDPSTSRRPPSSLASSSSSATLASSASPGSRKRKRLDATPISQHAKYSSNDTMHSNCPLRQHKHYRIVVEEVCMPLKNFQYGRQLVSIVLDCLRAHYQAAIYPKTRLLHCDISGGNILIYLKIRRDRSGKNPMVVWTGILSDWELSKPVDTQDAASRATQTDRMGTYEFMSVNLLNHITKPVKISDELESFFHVLVYYAVRHLCSNCTGVQSWIDNYFHRYSGPERMLTCGQKSYTVEVTGMLEIPSPNWPLTFNSPMDNVLGVILESIRAHYKVMEYDFAKAHAPPSPPRPETPPPSSPTASNDVPVYIREIKLDGVDEAQIAQWEAELASGPRDDSPTDKDRELAKNVADHKFMLGHLLRMLRDPRWSDDRCTSVPGPGSECPAPETPTAKQGGAEPSDDARFASPPPSSKRQRTSGPERNTSLPARLRTESRRARIRARTHPIRARR